MKILKIILFTMIALNGYSQTLKTELDDVLNKLNADTKTSYSLMIVQKGDVLYQNSKGNLTLDSKHKTDEHSNYRMASVSKQFTAAAIYLLEKQNKLTLTQSLSEFFPDFSAVGSKISLHHLLTHTSGILDYEELVNDVMTKQLSDQDILLMVKDSIRTYFEPGKQFRYSNTAYCILALIVEKVSGMSLQKYCDKYIFKPLQMKNTVWYGEKIKNRVYGYAKEADKVVFRDQSLTSATLGDGGLYTSLSDYKKWYLDRKKVLGMDFIAMAKKSSAAITGNHRYTYGWFYENDINGQPKVILHSGATCGFSNIVIEIPGKEMLIVYFTNLAARHNSFLPIESRLKEYKIVDQDFSYRKMHDETH